MEEEEAVEEKEVELSKKAQQRLDRLTSVNKRKTSKYIIWTIVAILVLGGIYWLILRSQEIAENRPGEEVVELGREHIAFGQTAEYNSNPPTSGPHYAALANFGVYQEELLDGQVIHNLEHGGIWISYKDVDDETKAKIEEIGKRFPGSVIVSPRAENDALIVLASWARLLKMESFDEDLIIEYIRTNRNRSPEPLVP